MCRITAPGERPEAREPTLRLLKAVEEREPQIYRSLLPSANETRRWLRDQGMRLPHGAATTDVPLLSLQHPELKARLRRCAGKLFLSLHYLHTKTILPSSGGMILSGFSNAVSLEEAGLASLVKMTPMMPEVRWQRVDVTSQFNYRYNADARWGLASVFLAQFNNGLGFGALCISDLSLAPDVANHSVIRPFGVS